MRPVPTAKCPPHASSSSPCAPLTITTSTGLPAHARADARALPQQRASTTAPRAPPLVARTSVAQRRLRRGAVPRGQRSTGARASSRKSSGHSVRASKLRRRARCPRIATSRVAKNAAEIASNHDRFELAASAPSARRRSRPSIVTPSRRRRAARRACARASRSRPAAAARPRRSPASADAAHARTSSNASTGRSRTRTRGTPSRGTAIHSFAK